MRGHSGGYAADLLVAALQARTALDTEVNVRREVPADLSDMQNSVGVYDAIWIGRQGGQEISDIEVSIPFGKPPPITWRENYTLWVTISCIRDTDGGTQKIATDRAVELLGELLGTIASAPGLGFVEPQPPTSADLSTFWCRGATELLRTGVYDSDGHGAGFEVGLRFHCQLNLS